MLQRVEIKENIIDKKEYDYLFSVEEVNKLVMQGLPFREAYKKVGKAILENDFNPERKVEHSHAGSIGNLCLDEIKSKFERNY